MILRLSISLLIGAAPDIAKRRFPKPAADLSFPLKIFESPGIFKPIFKINLELMAALKLE